MCGSLVMACWGTTTPNSKAHRPGLCSETFTERERERQRDRERQRERALELIPQGYCSLHDGPSHCIGEMMGLWSGVGVSGWLLVGLYLTLLISHPSGDWTQIRGWAATVDRKQHTTGPFWKTSRTLKDILQPGL